MKVSELIYRLQIEMKEYGDIDVSCGHHCVDRHEEPTCVQFVDGVIRINVEENMGYVPFN